nr:cellulose synthase 3 isoform 2 [Calliarthron tuberculosum]
MPIPSDPATRARFLYATGGSRGAQPLRPSAVPEWRPGLPLHWSEQTRPMKLRALVVRLLAVVHIAVSVAYLQYRARRTIGVFESSRHPGWRFAQILFYCYEVFVAVFALLQLPEHWNVMKRRSVDFDRVPRHLFAAPFDHPEEEAVPNDLRHYPSIAVIIPCYREDVGLVRLTVEAALALDYPRQLLSVYLCDDGRDPDKETFIARLQRTHPNVNYVARPNNDHAKPGNVNYTLERTQSHFVVQLDADFVARPQLIQRLLPYYFVWNADLHAYEYNPLIAAVQTPQHYRNLAPTDPDVFDQRIIFFNNMTLPGKDWFNASTMVGTGNILNREALDAAGNFPYHSFGDDTALSVIFHGLGYRTLFVNESVATGLVPSSLRGNLAQRARWYVTDTQILLSPHGACTQRGLSFVQRVIYFNMPLQRFHAAFTVGTDVLIVLMLVADFSAVDVVEPRLFLALLVPQLLIGMLFRFVLCVGAPGLFKSSAAHEIFEIAFKYSTMKGVFLAVFNNKKLRWKVAEKVFTQNTDTASTSSLSQDTDTALPQAAATTASDNTPDTGATLAASVQAAVVAASDVAPTNGSSATASRTGALEPTSSSFGAGAGSSKTNAVSDGRLSGTAYAKFVLLNLKRCWYNIIMVIVLTFALVWAAVVRPTNARNTGEVTVVGGVRGRVEFNNLLPIVLAFAFATVNLIAHLLILAMCFKREYVRPWTMPDLRNGTCDQWAIRQNGRDRYVPGSIISWIALVRMAVLVAALAVVAVFSISDVGRFVPV